MKTHKLISMTAFVLEVSKQTTMEGDSLVRNFNKIKNYTHFLKQPLKLEMFVPCDDNGNVLEEQKFFYKKEALDILSGDDLGIALKINEKTNAYRKAKEKVLFEGFEIKKSPYDNGQTLYIGWEPYNASIFINLKGAGWKTDDYKTIEDLFKSEYEIKLTPTAIKQIGL